VATKTTTTNSVAGLNRQLGALPKEASAELRDASVVIAEDVAADARRRAYQTGGVAFYVAPTIVPARDRIPKVKMGGTAKLPTTGSWGSRRRGSSGQTVGDVIWGAEFGGGARERTPRGGSTLQFMPHLGTIGYSLWPAVRALSPDIGERYSEALGEALHNI